jgi:hypothetical protein
MGGKTSTSTSGVTIPPEVLARYNAVNATAQNVAQTPFQQYSSNPNAFVAPVTPTQEAGIANTNTAAGMAQPYFNAASGFALAGSQAVDPGALNIGQYYNPYVGSVLGSTEQLINQTNQQQQAGQLGTAIQSGAFGGDRSGIAAANLAQQQQLAAGQTYSGILSDAYQQAQQTAMQQQGVGLAAQQANRGALQQTGEALAGLGTGAQGAALSGAQAQLGAGQVEQQTQQAGLTALYNQFLQQQSYPFQTAQFLANIAEGTGALSGSTTTTTQPGGLFSDDRLKEDIIPIGKTFEGQNVIRFRYRGDPTVRIGLSAQETTRFHPEAIIHHPSGFLAVDYGRATAESAGFALAANDDWEPEPEARRARAAGGRIARQGGGLSEWGMYPGGANPMVIAQLLQAQEQMYGPYQQGALYGASASGAPHGGAMGYVPQASLPVGQLQIAHPPTESPQAGLHKAAEAAGDVKSMAETGQKAANWLSDQSWSPTFDPTKGISDADLAEAAAPPSTAEMAQWASGREPDPVVPFAFGGFARAHRQGGGDLSDPENDNPYGGGSGPGLHIPTQGQTPQQLKTAAPPSQGESGFSKALGAGADIAQIGEGAAKLAPAIGSGISGLMGGLGGAGAAAGAAGAGMAGIGAGIGAGASGMASLLPFLMLASRGGRIRRAEGGDTPDDLYNDHGAGLDIPEEAPRAQLAVSQPSKSGSGGDQTMSDIMDIAKIAAMFANRGGRIGFADGGAPDAVDQALGGEDPSGGDPVDNILLRRFEANLHPASGFAHADSGAPQAGGPTDAAGGPPAAAAGFAGAAPPGGSGAPPGAAAGPSDAGPAPPGGLLGAIARAEGTGKNPSSSARGPFQMIDSTFEGLFRQQYPQRAASMSKGDIKALRSTPEGDQLSAQLAPVLAKQNALALTHAGIDPTSPGNAYSAWVLGPHDAIRVLHADPSTPLSQVVSPASIAANPSIMKGKTAGQFVGWAGQRIAQMSRRGRAAGGRAGYADGSLVDPNDPDNPTVSVPKHGAAATPAAAAASVDAAPAPTGLAAAAQPGPAADAAPAVQMRPATTEDYQTSAEAATQAATENLQGLVHAQNPTKRTLMDKITSPDFWIPALEGAAAWASAPTQHPLVAALVGAGQFAKGYQDQRAYEMGAAQKNLQETTLAAGAPTGVMTAQAGMLQARAQAAQLAQQRFQMMFRPALGPNAERGWQDMSGNFLTNDDYARRYEQVMGPYIDAMGGSDVAASHGVSATPPPADGANLGPPTPAPTGDGAAAVGAQPHPNSGGQPPSGGPGEVRGGDGSHPPAAVATRAPGDGAVAHVPAPAPTGVKRHIAATAPLKDKLAGGYYLNTGIDLPEPKPPVQLQQMSDPEWLTQHGQDLVQMGRTPEEKQQGATMLATAQSIRDGKTTPYDINGNPYNGYYQYSQKLGQQNLTEGEFAKAKVAKGAQASEWSATAPAAWNLENAINLTYRDHNTNRLTPQIAEVVGRLSSLPGIGPIVQKAFGDYQASNDLATKLTAAQTIMQANLSHLAEGAPATVTNLIGKTVPDPKMQPDARYELSVQTAQALKWGQEYWKNWGANQNRVDNVGQYDTDYAGEHPLSRYEAPMSDNIPYYAGMSEAGKKAFPRHPADEATAKKLPPGTPYVVPYGQHKGEIYWTAGKRDG